MYVQIASEKILPAGNGKNVKQSEGNTEVKEVQMIDNCLK